mgnify:CR=1 FL=1
MRNVPYKKCCEVLWMLLKEKRDRIVLEYDTQEEADRYAYGFYNEKDKINSLNFRRARAGHSQVRLISRTSKTGRSIMPDWLNRDKSFTWQRALEYSHEREPALV